MSAGSCRFQFLFWKARAQLAVSSAHKDVSSSTRQLKLSEAGVDHAGTCLATVVIHPNCPSVSPTKFNTIQFDITPPPQSPLRSVSSLPSIVSANSSNIVTAKTETGSDKWDSAVDSRLEKARKMGSADIKRITSLQAAWSAVSAFCQHAAVFACVPSTQVSQPQSRSSLECGWSWLWGRVISCDVVGENDAIRHRASSAVAVETG
ncbi:hypothetical protein BLNAU_20131 [Blattamonas nauphoetae]|uniref:Uncharacterized protein n=1 Tax=Blattamonas nauphoetae TaxID=2049346 RepID=A0ABQ9WZR4_9EUKA|nr:hypothetical protein BLNAU_20131 [Blattamonas nauphoetae]